LGIFGGEVLKVVLTIDTEFWPCVEQWPDHSRVRPLAGLAEAYERGVLGHTPAGNYGLPYLLQSLRGHNLRGVFFVESLSSSAIGEAWLQRTVGDIVRERQEVQLHLHTEWLSDIDVAGLPPTHRPNLGDFNLEEQTAIVRYGLAKLRDAGAPNVTTLRAGNMGGNFDTPFAARSAGLSLDMSFDPAQDPDTRAILSSLQKGFQIEDTCPTVPMSFVQDFPGHYRTAQLTALSFCELSRALLNAERERWTCFVVLLHSFELVQPTRHRFGPLRPHWINIDRWSRLCAFLAQNRDKFTTIGCDDLDSEFQAPDNPNVPRTLPHHTLWRMCEQLASRFI
jgi:hypothetical protein